MNLVRSFAITLLASLLATSPTFAGGCQDWAAGPMTVETGALSGTNGFVLATTTWDPDGVGPLGQMLVIGGSFTSVEGQPITNLAWRNSVTGQWQSLGAQFNSTVNGLLVWNGQLIAMGAFTHVGGTEVNYVARWDGVAWRAMNTGLLRATSATVVFNGDIYVTLSGSGFEPHVFRWTGSVWQPIGITHGFTNCMAVYGGSLYVGGTFRTAGSAYAPRIARWDGATWHGVGTAIGSQQVPNCMAVFQNELYVFGNEHVFNNDYITFGARWNGSTWQTMGDIFTGLELCYPTCTAVYNNKLHVGGRFLNAAGITVRSIAQWNGSSWSALGNGITASDSIATPVHTMTVLGNELIVGGVFLGASGVTSQNIVRWNGAQWAPYGGVSANSMNALTTYGTRLVAGGDFVQLGGGASPPFHIASWNGAEMASLGTGMNAAVNALVSLTQPDGDLELVAGGFFTTAGGTAANRVARWVEDPLVGFPAPQWSPMGNGFNGGVNALTRFNGRTIAGGFFTASGNGLTTLNRIARWNDATVTWEAMGGGLNGSVHALKAYTVSSQLVRVVAGGYFPGSVVAWTENTQIPSSPAWTQLGNGFDNGVLALEYHSGSLYAGGAFTASGGTAVNRIARFNTALNPDAWVAVGNGIGFNGNVTALKSIDGMLYAGGDFTSVDGVSAKHLARWNGRAWEEVEGGANGGVLSLALYHNEVHAGGAFESVRNSTLPSKSWAKYHLTGEPWIVFSPSSQTRACKSDFTFTLTPAAGYPGLSYAWTKDGEPLFAGPTGMGSLIEINGPTLIVSHASDFDRGVYACTMSNACGSIMSSGAQLDIISTCPPCPADLVSSATFAWPPDGIVDGADLAFLLSEWGAHPGPRYSHADIVESTTFLWPPDGIVDGADLAMLLSAWGPCD